MKKSVWYCAVPAVVLAGWLAFGATETLARAAGNRQVPAPILLNEDDNGTTACGCIGQYAVITLADPWSPPYGWELREVRGDAAKIVGRTVHSPGGQNRSGQSANQTTTARFRIQAVKEGQTTVSLVCSPPPYLMVPTRLYEVTLAVKP